MARIRFSLRTLMLMMAACCWVAAVTDRFGVRPVAISLSILAFLVAWATTYARAPRATAYGTVLLVMGVSLMSLLPCWMLRSREAARDQGEVNHLRQVAERLERQRLLR